MENEPNSLPFLLVITVMGLKVCEFPSRPLCVLGVQRSPCIRWSLPIPTVPTLPFAPSARGWISEPLSLGSFCLCHIHFHCLQSTQKHGTTRFLFLKYCYCHVTPLFESTGWPLCSRKLAQRLLMALKPPAVCFQPSGPLSSALGSRQVHSPVFSLSFIPLGVPSG